MQKRICSLLMAFVLLAGLAAPASAAAAKEHCKGTPVIIVQGFNALPLKEGDKDVFFPSDAGSIIKMVLSALVPLSTGLPKTFATKDPKTLADALLPAIRGIFGPLQLDVNRKPAGEGVELRVESFPKSMEHYPDYREYALGVGEAVAQDYGWDHVYLYTFDWRRDIFDIAKGLKDLIATVKKETGHSKVDLAALSMGAAVTSVYLAEYGVKNNFSDLGNVVYLSPGWQGASMVGAMLTGDIVLNAKSLTQLLMYLQGGDPVIPQWAIELALLPLVNAGAFGFLNDTIQVLEANHLRDMLKYWPGLWALCPQEDYQRAREICFPGGGTKEEQALLKSLDKYAKIQANITATIGKLQQAGHGFAVVSFYTQPLNAPIIEDRHSLWSDGTIDTYFTGGFPVLAKYPDGKLSKQAVNDGHDHRSPDGVVDASACLLPENTWFIKGCGHSNYFTDEWPSKLVCWLLEGGSKGTVRSNKNYPQFTVYAAGSGAPGLF